LATHLVAKDAIYALDHLLVQVSRFIVPTYTTLSTFLGTSLVHLPSA